MSTTVEPTPTHDHGGGRESAGRSPSATAGNGDVDDGFRALMEGLRVSLPGVQVLFGFLLVAPFQRDFSEYDATTVTSFAIAFLSAGLASVLLIAPSVHQRVRAPVSGIHRSSEHHLAVATRLTIVGTVAMGIAIAATIFLVANFVFEAMWASITAACVGSVLVWTWFYLPLVTFRR